VAFGTETGKWLGRESFPTPQSGNSKRDLDHIADRALRLARDQQIDLARVTAAGISLPGPLDLEAGVLLNPPNLAGWENTPVRDLLAARLGVPVGIENDANAAALAEWRFGAGQGADDVVYLTMSTGVGGGIVLGGQLQRGIQSSAGEIGHLPIEWDGEPCACGMRGCLEAYIGGAAWSRRLERGTPEDSRVRELAGDATPTPEHVVAAALAGDAFALAEFDRFNHYLAWGIVQIGFVLAPEVLVLGTIPTAAGPALCLDPVRAQVRERLWPAVRDKMRIEPAGCGDLRADFAGLSVAIAAAAGDVPTGGRR
jgi:glucokinase